LVSKIDLGFDEHQFRQEFIENNNSMTIGKAKNISERLGLTIFIQEAKLCFNFLGDEISVIFLMLTN
jgi:hypothetical protein